MPRIKRYPNRKLYNASAKEYITLDEIATLIRQGEEVHVVDHATGEDLTVLTLTQVLFEQVKQRTSSLPRTVLTALIQAGSSRMDASVLERNLDRRLASHQEVQALSEQLDELAARLDEYTKGGSAR